MWVLRPPSLIRRGVEKLPASFREISKSLTTKGLCFLFCCWGGVFKEEEEGTALASCVILKSTDTVPLVTIVTWPITSSSPNLEMSSTYLGTYSALPARAQPCVNGVLSPK